MVSFIGLSPVVSSVWSTACPTWRSCLPSCRSLACLQGSASTVAICYTLFLPHPLPAVFRPVPPCRSLTRDDTRVAAGGLGAGRSYRARRRALVWGSAQVSDLAETADRRSHRHRGRFAELGAWEGRPGGHRECGVERPAHSAPRGSLPEGSAQGARMGLGAGRKLGARRRSLTSPKPPTAGLTDITEGSPNSAPGGETWRSSRVRGRETRAQRATRARRTSHHITSHHCTALHNTAHHCTTQHITRGPRTTHQQRPTRTSVNGSHQPTAHTHPVNSATRRTVSAALADRPVRQKFQRLVHRFDVVDQQSDGPLNASRLPENPEEAEQPAEAEHGQGEPVLGLPQHHQ